MLETFSLDKLSTPIDNRKLVLITSTMMDTLGFLVLFHGFLFVLDAIRCGNTVASLEGQFFRKLSDGIQDLKCEIWYMTSYLRNEPKLTPAELRRIIEENAKCRELVLSKEIEHRKEMDALIDEMNDIREQLKVEKSRADKLSETLKFYPHACSLAMRGISQRSLSDPDQKQMLQDAITRDLASSIGTSAEHIYIVGISSRGKDLSQPKGSNMLVSVDVIVSAYKRRVSGKIERKISRKCGTDQESRLHPSKSKLPSMHLSQELVRQCRVEGSALKNTDMGQFVLTAEHCDIMEFVLNLQNTLTVLRKTELTTEELLQSDVMGFVHNLQNTLTVLRKTELTTEEQSRQLKKGEEIGDLRPGSLAEVRRRDGKPTALSLSSISGWTSPSASWDTRQEVSGRSGGGCSRSSGEETLMLSSASCTCGILA